MSRTDLGTYTFLTKYARYLPEKKRRETFQEACARTMDMHRRRYGDKVPDHVYNLIEDHLVQGKILGSQRNLQFAGSAIERINLRGYNCSFSHFDRVDFLKEAVWLLLCGCGTGFSVQKHHVDKLPVILGNRLRAFHRHVVDDSIEGWAEAFDVLFRSYTQGGMAINFDYSQVRPEGAPLSTSSAKAPGPKPLRDALEACRTLLTSCVGRKLRPIDAYDLVMHAASCVRAGGIRRSATIALFSVNDEEMMQAKTGNWFETNPQRRLSNNSAIMRRDSVSREQFSKLFQSTRDFGEPGFFFVDDLEHGTNPCAEILLNPVDDEGRTGWAFCNLTSVNVAACEDRMDFFQACAAASYLGTLQAGYQGVGLLGEPSKRIMERDALLGVSLTGMADNLELAFDADLLKDGSDLVRLANRLLASKIGINSAARLTTVKPEGTGSLVLGVGNGIHPNHSPRYLRYVEAGKGDPILDYIRSKIPEAVVPSAYAPDEFKIVFPVEAQGWFKRDTTALSHLEKVRLVQEHWVRNGVGRGKESHNVSNTIQVKEGEWDDVEEAIWENRALHGGVSLLGASGDLDYPQAPFVEVLTEEEIRAKYGDDPVRAEKARTAADLFETLQAKWPELDFTQVVEDEDKSAGVEVVACAGGACSF